MSTCLKIGDRIFNGDQIISALVQYQILETLIGQVLLDEAIQEIPLSKQELFYTLAGSQDAPVPEDLESFLAQWCQHQGVTLAYLNGVVLRKLRLEKFKQLYFATQVESEFLRTKSHFDQVEFSLIQLTDGFLAQELYFQLRDDQADFAQLAHRYSLGNEAQIGGRVGPVPMATLPVEVAKLFHAEPVGAVCEPIVVGDRLWIVRLEQLTIAQLTEATHLHLVNQLYTQWLQAQVKALIATPGAIAVQTLEESAKSTSGEALIKAQPLEAQPLEAQPLEVQP